MTVKITQRVTINLPKELEVRELKGATGIVMKKDILPNTFEVLVTSGDYLGKSFKFVETNLATMD